MDERKRAGGRRNSGVGMAKRTLERLRGGWADEGDAPRPRKAPSTIFSRRIRP